MARTSAGPSAAAPGGDPQHAGDGAGGEPGRGRVAGVEDGGARRSASASSSSPLTRATPARPPSGPAWARPMLVMTPDGGGRHRAESSDVAVGSCAHLEHERLGVRRRGEERERHAGLVVVRAGAGVQRELRGQRGCSEVFGAGLARRAGDADDDGVAERGARGATEVGQRSERVAHPDDRAVVARHLVVAGVGDQRDACTACEGVGHEVVAVAFGDEGDEARTGFDDARVDGERRHARVGATRRAGFRP